MQRLSIECLLVIVENYCGLGLVDCCNMLSEPGYHVRSIFQSSSVVKESEFLSSKEILFVVSLTNFESVGERDCFFENILRIELKQRSIGIKYRRLIFYY